MKRPNQPILTIVIPTVGSRQNWLLRAVDSALSGWEVKDCEILIILNVNLDKYEALKERFKEYINVSIVANENNGVSSARNLGISLAKGRAIRFLDDDDYLYPEIALQQTKELLSTDADLSSYGIDLIDENLKWIESRKPFDPDCITGLCSTNRLQIPVSFVYKLTSIKHSQWENNLSLAEDTVWLLSILEKNMNLKWVCKETPVGAWFQHQGLRLSRPYSTNKSARLIASKLIEIGKKLPTDNSYKFRASFIADAAWSCFLAGFKYAPIEWSRVPKEITKLNRKSKPNAKIYRLIPINPLILSWILLPAFWGNHALRLLVLLFRKAKNSTTS